MKDTDLMMRVRDGDEDAFREIVQKYHHEVQSLCCRYVGNHEDAEEVAQDVFIRLLRYAPSYKPKAKLSTYIYRIAVNLSLNKIRDRKVKQWVSWDFLPRREMKGLVEINPENPDLVLEEEDKVKAVRKALDRLPENQKTAVLLQRYQGLSYKEIAEVMNTSVSAVESLIFRSKKNLEKHLRPLIAS
jgi:RNA polymerase sigma-70 factor (ECF subfamily)